MVLRLVEVENIFLKSSSSAEKRVVFINENQSLYCEYMFLVRYFKNINWELVEFDEGNSQFLLFLVVYHILSETDLTFLTATPHE